MRSLLSGFAEAVSALAMAGQPTRGGPPVPMASRRGSLAGLLGGGGSSPDAQMRAMSTVGTLFAIVDAHAEAQSAVTWKLWKKAASGKKDDRTEIVGHAALDLWNNPNDFFDGEHLREAGQQHHELTGEIWLVVVRSSLMKGAPLEMWEIRPDRISPVPHPNKFIVGYEYKDPDGNKVPLELGDVLRSYRPNPSEPYRGISAVGAMLVDLDSAKYSAEWNRTFFLNSAEPGGIIEHPGTMNDTQWKRHVDRWREQHQGVSQAHRVATLEGGMKWVERKYTMREMQFTELRQLSDEMIRRAFRFPVPMLGTTNDVNRATAEAMDVIYGQWHVHPRASRWRRIANRGLLKMYPDTGEGIEFDFEPVAPADRAADNAELTARSSAAKVLVEAGYDRVEVLTAVGLPDIAIAATPEPAAPPVEEAIENLVRRVTMELDSRAADQIHFGAQLAQIEQSMQRAIALPAARAREVRPDLPSSRPRAASDLDVVHGDWEKALTALLKRWEDISQAQRDQIESQVRRAVEHGDMALLAALIVSSKDAADLLAGSMAGVGTRAGERMAGSARRQGVPDADDAVATFTADDMDPVAIAVASMLASGLAVAAGQEALRLWTPTASADQVADGVRKHLESLSDSHLRDRLGGVLWRATNVGRVATLNNLPLATYYATEKLDRNTCGPCKKIDDKQLPTLDAALTAYGGGGYLYCEGRDRCRGTFEAEWADET